MARRNDTLGFKYAKKMQHFGCGIAMFQPISAGDMRPPCVGYLEKDGTWNHIANITWKESDGTIKSDGIGAHPDVSSGHTFEPLQRAPRKMEQLNIEWRPRTSQGVRQWAVDASGNTPKAIPIGADTHYKFKSMDSFGAVLIAQKPITISSYNDGMLFHSWLSANRALLSSSYGPQLRRHGLRIVTRTYTAPSCSINAWEDEDKEAFLSLKARATMMGELGGGLDWTERLTENDWSHYSGKDKGDAVVVFFDGIEVPAWHWWLEGLWTSMGRGRQSKDRGVSRPSKTQSVERRLHNNTIPASSVSLTDRSVDDPPHLSLRGFETPLRIHSPLSNRSPSPSPGQTVQSEKIEGLGSLSTLSGYIANDEKPPVLAQRSEAAPVSNPRLSMMSTATRNLVASTRAPS